MKDIQEKRKEIGPFIPGPDDDLLICRCEEVTKGEIRQAVHAGMFTIEEIRRFLRSGMGSPAEIEPATSRAPMRPTEMRIMAKDGGDDRE